MKLHFKKMLSVIAILLFVVSVGRAQTFDYTEKPTFKYDFLEANIDLTLDAKKGAVKGSVTYVLKANVSGANSLKLQAPEIMVDSVLASSQSLAYTMKNDRLFITLTDSTVTGKQYRIRIFYKADPRFGILKDAEGIIWTSMLPKSHRHWIPSPDHPGIEAITTLTLMVPASYTVASTGVKTNEDILGLENKKVTFRSSKPIPITSVAFSAGKMRVEGTSFGIKRISTYAEPGTISRKKQNELATKASQIIQKVEEATNMKYPYQRMHVVVLGDHFWEQKPYGASVVYLYQNRGDLINQLRRGLYAQWFGVYQHEAQWKNAWPIHLFQAALHYKISNDPIHLKSQATPQTGFTTVYNQYSVNRWNFWQKMPRWKQYPTQQIAVQIIPEVLARGSGTYTVPRYENIWYRLSGQPHINIPDFHSRKTVKSNDQILYRIDIQPVNDSLKVAITSLEKPIQKRGTVSLKMISRNSSTVHKISFSGQKSSTVIPNAAGIKNASLLNKNDNIRYEIHKPVPFILYQLNNAKSVDVRKRAALQLSYHTDNPDLQLVITGYLKKKMKPEVRAALLKSYATITKGASGTQQYFIKALDSPHPVIRKAALKGIQNYKNDPQIAQKIKSLIKQSQTVTQNLLTVYMQRIDSTQALDFVQALVKQDTAGTKAIKAIAALAASGDTQSAVKLANYYIQPVYGYPVRKKALVVLLKYDGSAQRWNKRIKMLLTDLDPRIRYLTVQNMANIPGVKRGEVLQKYIPLAYDGRVYKAINNE